MLLFLSVKKENKKIDNSWPEFWNILLHFWGKKLANSLLSFSVLRFTLHIRTSINLPYLQVCKEFRMCVSFSVKYKL
jgi:hypothetical protein